MNKVIKKILSQSTRLEGTDRMRHFFHPNPVYVNPQFVQLTPFVKSLPDIFDKEGETIYQGRNVLKRFRIEGTTVIVKSYKVPILINRIAYRFLRWAKAIRSYRYAAMLKEIGVGSPAPVAYHVEYSPLLMGRSYFVSLESECPYTYREIGKFQGNKTELLRSIAQTTAKLHDNGILHKDYSAGNILFKETQGGFDVEIIDLNRIRFGNVDLETGCRNFSRLPGTPDMLNVLADEYARCRGFNAERCREILQQTHGEDNPYIQ